MILFCQLLSLKKIKRKITEDNMAVRRRKINYMGSLAEFKQSINESQVEGGGGAASIMGGGVMPGSYGSGFNDTITINEQGGTDGRGYYDFPDPYKPNPRRNRPDQSFKPADRYPDPPPPGQMPPRPVDRYPEATPNKPRIPSPRKPKPKKPKGGGGGGGSPQGVA
jgi:hypothetical protein